MSLQNLYLWKFKIKAVLASADEPIDDEDLLKEDIHQDDVQSVDD